VAPRSTFSGKKKNAKDPSAWLDDEEAARIANEDTYASLFTPVANGVQLKLELSFSNG
jgi:hypothetical protein